MKIFIDGQAGTTGLQLEERLRKREDIQLLDIDPDLRKDPQARKALMNEADTVFLCLPEDEAQKAATMVPPDTLLIDASTAHRTTPGWVYGMPELSVGHRAAIAKAKRIAVPGCHAAGFNALVYPLMNARLLLKSAKLHCTSITGYSGGGRSMIDMYEEGRTIGEELHAPRPYALGLMHKHLPEIKKICGLESAPHLMPVVGYMRQGMLVNVPLWRTNFARLASKADVWQVLAGHYSESVFIRVMPLEYEPEGGFLDPMACNGTNRMEIFVFGHDNQVLLAARHDNLGKGASGAAVQCMNIACGLDEATGLGE